MYIFTNLKVNKLRLKLLLVLLTLPLCMTISFGDGLNKIISHFYLGQLIAYFSAKPKISKIKK